MPELPEVETTCRGVEPHVTQQDIAQVHVYQPSLRWPVPQAVKALAGVRIERVFRRAKYLIFPLSDGQHLLMHLGMSGVIRVVPTNTALQKHDHFELVMAQGQSLRLNDPRRFGCVLLLGQEPMQHRLLSSLGPEPLSEAFNGQWLKNKALNKQQAVKNFIMDNHVVVGVGNIYAAESLFKAGINPLRAAGRISLQRYELLAQCIKQVLSQAITAGGTTLNDFKNTEGKPGYFKQELMVYGRAGKACVRCGNTIRNRILGQRASCYCPTCQT